MVNSQDPKEWLDQTRGASPDAWFAHEGKIVETCVDE